MNLTWIIMSTTISIMFPLMKHPLSMGLMLIMQTIMISMITGTMINTFWFSYILIMTMLSGALVLFTYMASIASNEKFNSSIMMSTMTVTAMITSTILPFLMDHMKTSKMWSTSKGNLAETLQMKSLSKLFSTHNMSITILMVCYLFLTMIAISYIMNTYEGPLRSKK